MDEGSSRIRRRVSVRKRNRPSLEILFAAPTADELKPGDDEKEEEEEEMGAGSPRRKTGGVQPVEVQPHQIAQVPGPMPHLAGRDTHPGLLLRMPAERSGVRCGRPGI